MIQRKIAIIGSGAMGSRHLQGIKKIKKFQCEIYVIDKNQKSLDLAMERYNEVANNTKIKKIIFDKSINSLPKELDLLINATTSSKRFITTKKVLDKCSVKYIIFEKILFNSEKEINEMRNLLRKKRIKSWVNCNYQCIPFFREIKKSFLSSGKLTLSVHGGNWSFGSSCIHFIDFFSFLINSKIDQIDFDLMSEKITTSKRKGYYEFGGIITARSKNKDYLIIECKKNSLKPLFIDLSNDKIYLQLEDAKRTTVLRNYKKKSHSTKKNKINFPMQSVLAKKLAEDILTKSSCDLPSYSISSENHILLFRAFSKNKVLKKYFPSGNYLLS